MTSRRTVGSRFAVGSSRITSGTSGASATTSASFCRMPVDICPTRRDRSSCSRSASASAVSSAVPGRSCEKTAAASRGHRGAETAAHRRAGTTAAVHGDALAVAVEPVDRRAAGRRLEKAQQQPQERRLAGAVGAQQAENLAALDAQRALHERRHAPVALRQRVGFNEQGGSLGGREVRAKIRRPSAYRKQPLAFTAPTGRRRGSLTTLPVREACRKTRPPRVCLQGKSPSNHPQAISRRPG